MKPCDTMSVHKVLMRPNFNQQSVHRLKNRNRFNKHLNCDRKYNWAIFFSALFFCSSSWCLWWKLHLSIGSGLFPWLPRQVRGWTRLLLDYSSPRIFSHPLQLHLLWHFRSDRHGRTTRRLHQRGGGTLRLAQPATGAGEHNRRLCHTLLLLRPNQPGPGICSALPR